MTSYRAPMPSAVERARFCAVPDGAEAWTRDEAGFFHRGVVTGPCRRGGRNLQRIRAR